jgi:predicted lipoprotein
MKNLFLIVSASALVMALSACSDFQKGSKKNDGAKDPEPQSVQNPFPDGILPKPNEQAFSRSNVLLNLGLNVIAPWTRDFEREAIRLEMSLQEACESSARPLNDPALTSARDSLKKMMLTWARLQMVDFGPSQAAGQFISSGISAWPWTNLCGVDRIVADFSETRVYPTQLIHTMRGLEALEHLLFAGDDAVRCNANLPAHHSVATWLKKDVAVRRVDRCQMAMHFSSTVKMHAVNLSTSWNPTRSNYTKTWVSDHGDIQASLNTMTDSLFFLEQVKDRKLAIPLGLSTHCAQKVCPEQIEAAGSELGLPLVLANLRSLQTLFHGSAVTGAETDALVGAAPYGLDDLLALEKNRPEVAKRIGREISAAIKTAENLIQQGSMVRLVNRIPEEGCGKLCDLHTQVRDVSRSLKTDFLGILELRPPRVIEGDND